MLAAAKQHRRNQDEHDYVRRLDARENRKARVCNSRHAYRTDDHCRGGCSGNRTRKERSGNGRITCVTVSRDVSIEETLRLVRIPSQLSCQLPIKVNATIAFGLTAYVRATRSRVNITIAIPRRTDQTFGLEIHFQSATAYSTSCIQRRSYVAVCRFGGPGESVSGAICGLLGTLRLEEVGLSI